MTVKFNPFTGNLDLTDVTAAAGSDTQVQYNDGGSLAGSADLTWDDANKELGVGGDIAVGTTTGTKIGTATNQKLAFWDKTPVVQPTTGISEAAFVASSGGSIHPTSTFGGYTIAQIAQALIDVGILA